MARVLIEFTEATDAGRTKGERVYVDSVSAKSFCDRKKVAKRVGDPAPVKVAPPAAEGVG